MRSFFKIFSAAGLAMALAASAQAAPFTGFVSFGLSSLPPLVASGSGNGNSPGPVTIATAAWAATGPVLLTLNPPRQRRSPLSRSCSRRPGRARLCPAPAR